MVAQGMDEQAILEADQDLQKDDIKESVGFTANAVHERQIR